MKIHILGPSGGGTTTLGHNLSHPLGIRHFDTDAFYWQNSAIPFTEKVPVKERLSTLQAALNEEKSWILSGSLCSWGDPLIPAFTHVIYLWIPWSIRQQRLINREVKRYGPQAIEPGGKMHEVHQAFLAWAGKYDSAGLEQRSRDSHELWLSRLPPNIHLMRFETPLSEEELVQQVLAQLWTYNQL